MSVTEPSDSSTKSAYERRCGERVSINLPVEFIKPCSLNGKLIDLSLCGCGVLMNEPLQPKDEFLVHINLPSEDGYIKIDLSCVVARCDKVRGQYLTGLAFNQMKPYQAYEINAFFNYHQRFES